MTSSSASPARLRPAGFLRAREEARAAFARPGEGPIALLDLLGSGDPDAFVGHLEDTLAAVVREGGRRLYGGALDGSVSGRPLAPYDAVVLEWFPSRASCLRALDSAPDERFALRRRCAIPIRPAPRATRLLVRLVTLLAKLRPLRLRGDPPPLPGDLNDEIGLSADEVQRFMEADQRTSLVVVNLNRYRARSREGLRSGGGGAAAYQRYGRNTAPLVLRRGGRVRFAGRPETALIAPPGDPVAGPWDGFALVYYPSRLAMRDMIASQAYARGTPYREAGLARAVVAPGTPWPAFDPKG